MMLTVFVSIGETSSSGESGELAKHYDVTNI